jgi:hypothetical protein
MNIENRLCFLASLSGYVLKASFLWKFYYAFVAYVTNLNISSLCSVKEEREYTHSYLCFRRFLNLTFKI